MPRRLAIFLDGTWNSEESQTNVFKLKELALTGEPDQLVYYDEGVGTKWYDKLTGGVFGHGLVKNIRQAYQWLRDHYEPDDQVYVFGFSRGAYTARAFAGFIARCGLLSKDAPMSTEEIFNYYEGTLVDKRPLYKLEFEKRKNPNAAFTDEEKLLLAHSKRIMIRFQGMWDTVGTHGVPAGNIPRFSRKSFVYLNLRPSVIFEHSCHALAIDEFRGPYQPWLWKKFTPKNAANNHLYLAEANRALNYQQRWFAGAHSNVGGGYPGNRLSDIPLQWIQSCAKEAGLHFKSDVVLRGDEHMEKAEDSFGKFLFGFYRIVRFGSRVYRTIERAREEKEKGYLNTINEIVDESVFKKIKDDEGYKVADNLADWAKRKGVTLKT